MPWDKDTRLRSRPVLFISGGLVEPLKELSSIVVPDKQGIANRAADEEHFQPEEEVAGPSNPDIVVAGAQEAEKPQPEHSDSSDSDGEVILFKGRQYRNAVHVSTSLYDDPDYRDVSADVGSSGIRLLQESPESRVEQLSNSSCDEVDAGGDETSPGDEETDDVTEAEPMDDAELARRLTLQEELGLGGDELLLCDAGAASDLELPPNRTNNGGWDIDFARLTKTTGAGFPSATALADALDSFVLGETIPLARPRKSKGKKALPDFNTSDLELASKLEALWEADRQRKKEKKLAREALRAQGLLRQSGDGDLRATYATGMTADALRHELKTFLLSKEEQYDTWRAITAPSHKN
jgi:hypothetical protein